jgi:hypothetical protein
MSGPPFNYADVTFRVTIRGDGRSDSYVLRPINPNTAAAWSPPVALDVQSPMIRQTVTFSAGSQNGLTGTYVNSLLPYTPSYVALVPSLNSTNPKTMQGLNTDRGISLIPNEALILALPTPLPSTWALVITVTNPEVIDFYIW